MSTNENVNTVDSVAFESCEYLEMAERWPLIDDLLGRPGAFHDRLSAEGKETVLRIMDPGEVVGEIALLDGQPRSANVIALTDSMIASLSGDAFWQVLREQPEVAAITLKRLGRCLAHEVRRQTGRPPMCVERDRTEELVLGYIGHTIPRLDIHAIVSMEMA